MVHAPWAWIRKRPKGTTHRTLFVHQLRRHLRCRVLCPSPMAAASSAPKILLAKPGSVPGGSSVAKFARSDDESVLLRSRLPPLNLLSDSWDFHTDRILPFLTENTDFTVIGVIGPPGVGKSTILNELYGFDGTSPGMLPPFVTQSEETRAMAKHCTTGIELRISAERLILLDTQPIFSPSILAEMTRPDGSSTISIGNGEQISADLAHELMSIQLGVFLVSICQVILVITEGVHDFKMWHLMLTVDLLKHGIPDPSLLVTSSTHGTSSIQDLQTFNEEYLATPVFVHTKLQDRDLFPSNHELLKKGLSQFFKFSSFCKCKVMDAAQKEIDTTKSVDAEMDGSYLADHNLFVLPFKSLNDSTQTQHASYASTLEHLRNKLLSMNSLSFAKVMSERDWLWNVARIWDMVKNSPIVAEYCRTLQSSGMFRR